MLPLASERSVIGEIHPKYGYPRPMCFRERKEHALEKHYFKSVTTNRFQIHKSTFVAALLMFSVHSVAGEIKKFESISESRSEELAVNSQSRNPTHSAFNLNNNQCVDCHEYQIEFSHPVGVYPPASMSVPANFPLIDGKVVCITCHLPYENDHSTGKSAQTEQVSFSVHGTEICTQCHDPNGFSVQDMHSRTTRKAHVDPSTDRYARTRQTRSSAPTAQWLDSESDSCMTCHDGAMASSSGSDIGSSHSSIYNEQLSSDHPIGRYQLSNPSESDGTLKPSSMIDSRIRLINNHVGCNSCHSVYSPQNDLLVMSNQGSRLCLECHEY